MQKHQIKWYLYFQCKGREMEGQGGEKMNQSSGFQLTAGVYNFINFNHQKQFTNKIGMSTRRNIEVPLIPTLTTHTHKHSNYSPSTEDSASPRDSLHPNSYQSSIRKDKEKSQLCKKYVEFGFCPYQKKCKFAHGSHQLRKNQQVNSKYKTKECGVFLNQGFCMYGERCNFIHTKPQPQHQHQSHIDAAFMEIKAEVRLQSRLLTLLSHNLTN